MSCRLAISTPNSLHLFSFLFESCFFNKFFLNFHGNEILLIRSTRILWKDSKFVHTFTIEITFYFNTLKLCEIHSLVSTWSRNKCKWYRSQFIFHLFFYGLSYNKKKVFKTRNIISSPMMPGNSYIDSLWQNTIFNFSEIANTTWTAQFDLYK